MKSDEKSSCEQRWDSIGRLERQFMKNPTQNDAIALRDLYRNWVDEGWADIGGYRGFATERTTMYSGFINGTKTKSEVINHIRKDLPRYFK